MDSAYEHNYVLEQKGMFSSADLKENQQGRYSPAQLQRFQNERDFMQYNAVKYENKSPLISLVFSFGLVAFAVVLYFVGVFDVLQSSLSGLFLPVMACAGILAVLFVFVIVPRQYRSSVEMAKGLGTPLAAGPLGDIQVIEACAETFKSQGGINRRGHQSPNVSCILKMEGIEFRLSDSFFEVIQPKRMYRVYAVKDQGAWVLLSMETLE
ncbi:MAG: hypothetical protein QY332_04880 [Anaerolineales bacterium]|nr:MAG: hypothetical protein QY332_04880 [Anaerolineales bacterium]